MAPKPSLPKYTEAELLEFEEHFGREVCELTDYIRQVVGTVEIPPFAPLPDAVTRSIMRNRRKVAREELPPEVLRHFKKTRLPPPWRVRTKRAESRRQELLEQEEANADQ